MTAINITKLPVITLTPATQTAWDAATKIINWDENVFPNVSIFQVCETPATREEKDEWFRQTFGVPLYT